MTLIETIARAIADGLKSNAVYVSNDLRKCIVDGGLFDLHDLAAPIITAITEAGYEIAAKGTIAALDTSRVAIDDWLNTYAHDMCDEKRVKVARDRIYENGGTIAYIARIQEHNRSISAAQGDG